MVFAILPSIRQLNFALSQLTNVVYGHVQQTQRLCKRWVIIIFDWGIFLEIHGIFRRIF